MFGLMVIVDGRSNRRVRKVGVSWGEFGFFMDLLRGLVRGFFRDSVVGLVFFGFLLRVLIESCGDLFGIN